MPNIIAAEGNVFGLKALKPQTPRHAIPKSLPKAFMDQDMA